MPSSAVIEVCYKCVSFFPTGRPTMATEAAIDSNTNTTATAIATHTHTHTHTHRPSDTHTHTHTQRERSCGKLS